MTRTSHSNVGVNHMKKNPDEDIPTPRVSTSLEMKINLGNYESASVFIAVSGLPVDATEADVEALLDTGRIAYDAIKRRLQLKVGELKAKRA